MFCEKLILKSLTSFISWVNEMKYQSITNRDYAYFATTQHRLLPGGDTLYKLFRRMWPQRVWFFSGFGLKTGVDFISRFGLRVLKRVWILETMSENRNES